MSWLDMFAGSGGSAAGAGASGAGEASYLRSLGQQVPEGVTFEGPTSYMDPAEQQQLFPQGLPSAQRSGGLAQMSALSRYADLFGGGLQGLAKSGAQQAEGPKTEQMTPVQGQQEHIPWDVTAPDAMAEADKA